MTVPAILVLNPELSLKGQRTALGVDALAQSFLDNLFFVQGRSRERATVNDLTRDEYMLLADYQLYIDSQDRVGKAYRDHDRWTRMSMLNIARIGKFSSDRSIRDYCPEIWKTWPVKIEV